MAVRGDASIRIVASPPVSAEYLKERLSVCEHAFSHVDLVPFTLCTLPAKPCSGCDLWRDEGRFHGKKPQPHCRARIFLQAFGVVYLMAHHLISAADAQEITSLFSVGCQGLCPTRIYKPFQVRSGVLGTRQDYCGVATKIPRFFQE